VLSNCAKLFALKLFDDFNNNVSTKGLLGELYVQGIDLDNLSLFSVLHCASLSGIAGIIAGLVAVEDREISQEDCVENTPLVLAAKNGHEGVVEILLRGAEVKLDRLGSAGWTRFI